ncbi:MAG: tryptophan synthase subunit alpha [Anaerobutyricum soehngenii]
MEELQHKNEKAFVTYMTAGLPDMEGTKALIKAQAEAGIDIIELGIPFSDPTADGPVIQDASYRSICKGTNLKGVFAAVEEVRKDCDVPLVFMMYYNTILYYGVDAFARKCAEAGVDGLIIPDLPKEEQFELAEALEHTENAPILIQLVAPVSADRIPMILENARGYVLLRIFHGRNRTGGTFPQKRKKVSGKCKSRIKDPCHDGIRNPHSRRRSRIKRYD